MHFDIPSELEFWCSTSWVELWAGAPLQTPQPGSAAGLVQAALVPGINVGFPEITEICDRIAAEPDETAEAVDLLVRALRDTYSPLQKKLKALTISNELMYDGACADIFSAFCSTEGLREALVALRSEKENIDLGAKAVEICRNIRMFATEIDKKCFLENGTAIHRKQARRVSSSSKPNVEASVAAPRHGQALEPRRNVVQDQQLQPPMPSATLPAASAPVPSVSPPTHPLGTAGPPLSSPPAPAAASPPAYPLGTMGPSPTAVSNIEVPGGAQPKQPPLPMQPAPAASPPSHPFGMVEPPLSAVSSTEMTGGAQPLQPPLPLQPAPAASPPSHPFGMVEPPLQLSPPAPASSPANNVCSTVGPAPSAINSTLPAGTVRPPLPMAGSAEMAGSAQLLQPPLPLPPSAAVGPQAAAAAPVPLPGTLEPPLSIAPLGLPHVPVDAAVCPRPDTAASQHPAFATQAVAPELGTATLQPPGAMQVTPALFGAVEAAFNPQATQAQTNGGTGEGCQPNKSGLDSLFD